MRVKLQLVIGHDEGQEETGTDVIALDKNQQRTAHRGLTLAESKQLLSTIQRHLLLAGWAWTKQNPAPAQESRP